MDKTGEIMADNSEYWRENIKQVIFKEVRDKIGHLIRTIDEVNEGTDKHAPHTN